MNNKIFTPKRFFLGMLLLMFALPLTPLQAQDVEQDRATMKKVREAFDRYLFASSSADSLEKARANAVAELASNIRTTVERKDVNTIHSRREGRDIQEQSTYDMISKTFTNVDLTAYQTLIVGKPSKKDKNYTVFVYISLENVNKIIAEIKEKEQEDRAEQIRRDSANICFYYHEGLRSMKEMRVGDALKNLYWSYVLGLGTDVKIEEDGMISPASLLAESRIDQVLNGIQISAVSSNKVRIDEFREKTVVDLSFECTWEGKTQKVTNLDYTYNDGNVTQRGPRVRDGVGTMDIQGNLDEVRVSCIYKYDQSETSAEVYEVVKAKGDKTFASATKVVKIDQVSDQSKATAPSEAFSDMASDADTSTIQRNHDVIMARMQTIEQAIREKDYGSVVDFFTEEGYKSFTKLIKYGDATIIGEPQYRFLDFGQVALCRGLTMQFRFKRNKQFIEHMEFRFNNQNLVESIAFTLTNVAENDLLGKGSWDRNERMCLMTFLEDYQTAYALGRIEYLERIFSDKALIIRGTKLYEKKTTDDGITLAPGVVYDTMSKAQYMDHLRNHFRTKEYINLNFTETDFDRTSNADGFYTIRVRQEYFSNTYGDVGWLFLLVDLRGEDPVIHVRAWQNDKLPLKSLIGIHDFY